MQMSQDAHRLPGRGKFVVTRKRDKDFVANSANIDNRLCRQCTDQFAVQKRDHVLQPLTDEGETANLRAL